MPRSSPDDNLVQMEMIAQAWEKLRRDKSFGGITLEQFKAVVQKSHDAHAEVARLEGRMRATRALLAAAEARTEQLLQGVEESMKSARKKGEDSPLSEAAVGNTPKRRRKNGRARKPPKG